MPEYTRDRISFSYAIDDEIVAQLAGVHDQNFRVLADLTATDLIIRNGSIAIKGPGHEVARAVHALDELVAMLRRGHVISTDSVKATVRLVTQEKPQSPAVRVATDIIARRGKVIRAKTPGQQRYVDAIDNNTIIFGLGPAGSGKTYLAMAKAVQALNNKEVNRIILTRPAVEAGEKLGFLPGTLNEKIDPYLRPLHDALRDMVEVESIAKLMETGVVEVAPLAYMRGRTLNDAFVILDEAQNTTPAQMKMFLTRLGFGSKMVVTGDITQVDLPGGQRSGLKLVRHILRGVPGVHFSELGSEDVVRPHLVGAIVDAYDAYENEQQDARDE